jgi:leucine dehydrogenase
MAQRVALFEAFGEAVTRLGGRYITAEDVGSTTADMHGVPRQGAFGGDPSPKTAFGVFVAIEEGVRRHLKRPLSGATVSVQGLGSVGMRLCEQLHEAGARLVVADLNEARCREAAAKFGARVVDADTILFEPVDVLAPCALGAVLDRFVVERVQASIVAGAANNQLATLEDGDRLHERGVLYLPDFLVNAGGIISAAREYLGTGGERAVLGEIALIGGRVAELLERSTGQAPARVAQAWAQEKLNAPAATTRNA